MRRGKLEQQDKDEPVPAPATKASTFPEEGFAAVDGVATTASIISGPVVSSCAKGLLTLRYWSRMMPPGISRANRCATPRIVKELSHEKV